MTRPSTNIQKHLSSKHLGAFLIALSTLVAACDSDDEVLDDQALEAGLEHDLELAPVGDAVVRVLEVEQDQYGHDLDADELTPLEITELGATIGIGPEDVPTTADQVTLQNDPKAISLRWQGSFWFGDDLFGKSYDIIRGPSSCGTGKTRAFASAYVDSGKGYAGSCYVAGWYTFDPNDCRIRVRINQPGWFQWGICDMFVYVQ